MLAVNEALFCHVAAAQRRLLLSVAARVVGPAEAEDVVQTALLHGWRRRDTFVGGEVEMRRWLAALTTNAALDERRRWRARPWLATGWLALACDVPDEDDDARQVGRVVVVPVDEETPEAVVLRAEERRHAHDLAHRMLAACTLPQRRAVWASYALEESQGTLARRWGMSEPQFKGSRHRGRLRCLQVAAQVA